LAPYCGSSHICQLDIICRYSLKILSPATGQARAVAGLYGAGATTGLCRAEVALHGAVTALRIFGVDEMFVVSIFLVGACRIG
jgi:hypothetical protein